MISRRLSGVSFSTYTSDDIRQLSVKQITNPDTFDDFLHPTFGGLYDPALGPNDKDDLCGTCGVNYVHCPGHLGHIELPLPVYHPLFLRILLQVLKVSCFNCHKLLITKSKEHLFCRQLEALDSGFTAATENLADAYHSEHAEGILQGLHGDELEDHLIAEIDQHFNSIVFGGSKHSCKTSKNTTKFRQAFVKDFFSITRGQTCCHCHAPVRDVRAEYNSRLYLKPVPAKQVHKWATLQVAREISDKTDSRNDVDTATDDKGNDNSETKKKNTSASDMKNLLQQTYVTPIEVREHLRLLWQNNKKLLKLLFGCSLDKNSSQIKTADMFFMDVVPVPPSRFRPISTLGEKRFENPQTTNLNKVLVDCALIHQCLKDTRRKSDEIEADPGQVQITPSKKKRRSGKGGPVTVVGQTPAERLQNSWLKLQVDINCFMDSDLDKLNTDKQPGIRQILEKKEGLFRKHMMGKRVNYAARSVISPDPYLNTDEIGVPEVFAKKLTYPQPVTPWNCQQLRRAILNGPSVHPGAVMIENEDGRKTILNPNNLGQRQAIAKRLLTPSSKQEPVLGCKKVYRHLINGDVLLLNRQPTLHRPSIMAHKARVLPNERTIRLHYANCKAYNADFDGDEMNAHFPQNELARAEAYQLVSTNFNYLGPKDGKPLSGLIQDHMVAGVLMTTRGTLYDRNDYHSLVYNALIDKKGRVETLRPCILKPTPLWSGKQVVSTVLINIIPYHSKLNLNGRAKISDQNWPKMSRHDSPLLENAYKDPHLNEAAVIFRNGELITGILDKSQYGSTPLGLVHCVYELYGGEISGKLLSTLARLFTNFHRLHGFTLGVEDILVTSKADQKRRKFMKQARKSGTDAATTALGLEDNCEISELNDRLQKAQHSNKGIDLKQLDLCVKKKTDHFQNKINSACVPYGLIKQFPNNALQLMVQSGAKGSAVNCMQISSLLGQIELEGRRPPLMLSGRSLPSFVPYDTSPRAGGFVDGRFLTGIRPQEYFFHCMAGREGLVDTAVKTSRSGYLQRCLIKHLEGLMVNYDLTVRDGDGSVVQFLYGEDGIDVSKTQFLEDKQYGFIARNYKGYINQLKPHRATDALERKKATKLDSKISKWKHKHGEPFSSPLSHNKPSPYLLFEKDNKEDFQSKYSSNTLEYSRSEVDQQLIDTWHKLNGPTSHHYERKCRPCPDPVISVLPPDQHYGSVSENFASRLNSYVDRNPDDVLDAEDSGDSRKLRCDKFLALMWFKYARSLSNPGEAVGLLAGQSLGEPSTQMTLNTFHFAGRGEMNVTLGIPRLREILMTASAKIKTPTMDVLIKEGPKALRKATRLQKKLNRVTLSEVIEKIEVWEVLSPGGANDGASSTRSRQFRIRVEFLPRSIYKDDCALKPGDVLSFVERTFIRRIIVTVTKTVRLKEKQRLVDSRTEERQRATAENEDEEGGRESPEPPDEDDEDDADLSEDDVEVDADAANQKERQRRTQFTSYEEPDDEELKNIEASDNEEEDSTKVKSEMEDVETESNTNITIDNLSSVDQMDPDLAGEEDIRVATVLASAPQVVGYRYDKEKERWCEVTLRFPVIGTKVMLLSLIEKLAEKAVLNESPGIKRCFVSESNDPKEKGRHRLKTEGVNLTELWNSPETLELNSLYTNEIHAFAKTYGIEAARRVLIKEITNVFKVYGIEIDPRHLNLVGDYMTFEGAYKPFNRQGIESNPFPLQKMTFETTTHFLRQASAFGRVDNLGSPSSRLVVGRVVNSGTGLFELRQPLTL